MSMAQLLVPRQLTWWPRHTGPPGRGRERRASAVEPNTRTPAHPQLSPATRFKVVGKLGQGAFAEVLRVRPVGASTAPGGRTSASRDLAFKVLKPADATGAGGGAPGVTPCVLLFREARALKHARHP